MASVLALFCCYTLAQVVQFNWLASNSGQKSALSGSCAILTNGTSMDCTLRQIGYRYKLSREEANKQIRALPSELEVELEGANIKDWLKTSGIPCDNLSSHGSKINDKELFWRVEELCQSPTKHTLIEFMKYSVDASTKTCVFAEFDLGSYTFMKINKTRWVSNNGPTGECGTVVVMALDQHPEYSALWTYSQSKPYLSTETEMCKSLASVAEPIEYSWNAPEAIRSDCQFIEFGL